MFARLSLLVHANERKAAREAILRDAAGALARATTVRQMHEIAVAAITELLPAGEVWVLDGATDAAPAAIGMIMSIRDQPRPEALGTSGGGSSTTSPLGRTGAGRRGGRRTITRPTRRPLPDTFGGPS